MVVKIVKKDNPGIYLEAINGEHKYTETKARIGTLDKKYWAVIPSGMKADCSVRANSGYTTVTNWSEKRLIEVYLMNAFRLMKAGVSDKLAAYVAFGRAVAIGRGLLMVAGDFKTKRIEWITETTGTNDITFNSTNGNVTGRGTYADDSIIQRAISALNENVSADIYMVLEIIFALIHINFLKTAHHVKISTIPWIKKMFLKTNAEVSGSFPLTQDFFYMLTHPFGIRRAAHLTTVSEFKDELPSLIQIRLNSCPAGSASICTAAAIIESMKSTKIYDEFKRVKGTALKNLLGMAEKIKKTPYKYHIVGRLYGAEALTNDEKKTYKASKTQAEAWAPLLVAYINVFASRSPISEQKCLDKYADANDGLRLTFEMALRNEYQRMSSATSLRDLFSKL